MQAYENRSNSMDKIARQRSDFILDQERYIDPAYQSQGWINGLGETIYSPTNSYNPNLDRGLNNLNYEKLLKKE